MLVFEERGKLENPEKNLLKQGREPTTNSTHIWRRVRESNPGHIGGRRVLSPLRHPCSPYFSKKLSLTSHFSQNSLLNIFEENTETWCFFLSVIFCWWFILRQLPQTLIQCVIISPSRKLNDNKEYWLAKGLSLIHFCSKIEKLNKTYLKVAEHSFPVYRCY